MQFTSYELPLVSQIHCQTCSSFLKVCRVTPIARFHLTCIEPILVLVNTHMVDSAARPWATNGGSILCLPLLCGYVPPMLLLRLTCEIVPFVSRLFQIHVNHFENVVLGFSRVHLRNQGQCGLCEILTGLWDASWIICNCYRVLVCASSIASHQDHSFGDSGSLMLVHDPNTQSGAQQGYSLQVLSCSFPTAFTEVSNSFHTVTRAPSILGTGWWSGSTQSRAVYI